jgi:hypothetical protein
MGRALRVAPLAFVDLENTKPTVWGPPRIVLRFGLLPLPMCDNPIVGGRVLRRFRCARFACSDWVQVDIDSADNDGRFIGKFPTAKTILPKRSRAAVLTVTSKRNVLTECGHEEGRVGQPPAQLIDAFGRRDFQGDLTSADFLQLTVFALRQMCNLQPPTGNFFVGKSLHDVWPISQDDVQVIGHLRTKSDFDGEQTGQEFL